MARKKKHEEHENLERWLVSYADFMTLLFATFVVLYALSQLDLEKFKNLKVALRDAFNSTSIMAGKTAIMQNESNTILENQTVEKRSPISSFSPQMEMKKKMEQAEESLNKEIKEGKLKGVSAKMDKRGLVISLVDSVFFDSGSAIVKNKAKTMLNKVALLLKKDFSQNSIRVEGHTDDDPIRTSVYPSNWELSGSRASSVVRYFIKDFKMNKKKFSAVGYADARPLVPNNTVQGKKKNRRVEIVVLNSTPGDQAAPGSGGNETNTNIEGHTVEEKPFEVITGGKGIAGVSDTTEVEQENTPKKEADTYVFDPINKDEMPVKKKETAHQSGEEIQEVERETFH